MGTTRSTRGQRVHGGARPVHSLLVGAFALAGLLAASPAHAGPREDLKAAYNKALGQYNNLELDQALQVLDEAIAARRSVDDSDPALAPLLVLRAGVIFSNTGKADQTKEALAQAVKVDYNVQIPADLRSPQFQKLLDETRKAAGSAPPESLRHTPPAATCGGDIPFEVVVSNLVDGGQVAFYWRVRGSSADHASISMDTFGNLATVTLPASDHGDQAVEYFVYVFDASNKPLANKGDAESPLILEFSCEKEEEAPPPVVEPPKPKTTLPRFFVNLGVGTGVGIAHGKADLTYQQYSPRARDGLQQFQYGLREYACAIARWRYPQDQLAGDIGTFYADLQALQATGASLPAGLSFVTDAYTLEDVANNYDPAYCGEHHGIDSGLGSAPFHVAPEFGFRVTDRLVLSVQARLQVVTGSKVYRDNPKEDFVPSLANNVYDMGRLNPEGVRIKPPFSFMAIVKAKYMLGKDDAKFRPFVGGMIGGGTGARLRVNMGFANDRNGNSIPDDREFAFDLLNEDAAPGPMNPCVPVWPYNNGCVPGLGNDPMNNLGDADRIQAGYKAMVADKSPRIDTVSIGPIMLGAIGGFHYQIVKNFAIFGEVQLGGWFWKRSSLLLDFNLGPSITF